MGYLSKFFCNAKPFKRFCVHLFLWPLLFSAEFECGRNASRATFMGLTLNFSRHRAKWIHMRSFTTNYWRHFSHEQKPKIIFIKSNAFLDIIGTMTIDSDKWTQRWVETETNLNKYSIKWSFEIVESVWKFAWKSAHCVRFAKSHISFVSTMNGCERERNEITVERIMKALREKNDLHCGIVQRKKKLYANNKANNETKKKRNVITQCGTTRCT